MLGASAVGRRIRYDATLDVHMQVQLHKDGSTAVLMGGGPGEGA